MSPNVTPAVARALEAAQQAAHRAGAPDVRPLDLLVGLLDEEDGRAAVLLANAGLLVAAFRAPPDAAPAGARPLPLGSAAQQALARARQLAREFAADRTVSGELLVLAL